ncbi:MAG: helix-turn-helix domain-containing protein [Vicinamibacterales bacterium]
MSFDATADFGSALRLAREQAGRSIRDVADATKLGARTLEALERNQVERLPPGIFRRAVVRAYAKEVGLDPEAVLRAFLERHPDDLPPPGRPVGPVADLPAGPRGRPAILWTAVVIGLVLAIVVAVLLWWPRASGASGDHPPSPAGRAGRQASGEGVTT